MTGGFYHARVKSSQAVVIIRIEGNKAQIVERVKGTWEYDQNWYMLDCFDIEQRVTL